MICDERFGNGVEEEVLRLDGSSEEINVLDHGGDLDEDISMEELHQEQQHPVGPVNNSEQIRDSSSSSSNCSSGENIDENYFIHGLRKYNKLSFSPSNARSLASKVDSLIDMFMEKDLHYSLITETWFKNDKYTKQELEHIKYAENIEFICKNRGSRGGGVAIAFNNTSASFKPIAIRGNKYELIGAVGRTGTDPRKCVVFALYIPPKQTAKETEALCSCLADAIEHAKLNYSDPYIVCLLYTSDAADE